ncbi:cytochrome c family protein [Sulfurimonas sp.]|nr:cytochrome c family protein [Sulfurimonas sp.]
MKLISIILLLLISLHANDGVHKFAPSSECNKCHTTIYSEFKGSMHAKATPSQDPIHKAVWDKHPKNKKFNQYVCGKCHTPAANNLDKMITKGQKAMPDPKNATHQEAISCTYCHRITDVKLHAKSNTNIISTDENLFHHKDMSDEMKAGKSCIGCHSHKANKAKLNVCTTDIDNQMGKNCVSCHMPKLGGHTFHGFAGTHNNSEMLEKYVDISIVKNNDNFVVHVKNKSTHALLLHPLRVGVLKMSVTRGSETIKLKKEVFVRIIGKNKKPAMPWVANEVIKNTMIQANENRAVKRDFMIQHGDKINVVLGWFLVNPKAVKKLGLEKEKVATEFKVFKKESFEF